MTPGPTKYGRLFTEEDVRRLMGFAAHRGCEMGSDLWDGAGDNDVGVRLLAEWDGAGAALDDVGFDHGRLAFPADEPLFLLRAQDKIAPGVVAAYYGGTLAHGCPSEHSDAVQEAYERMRAWQAVHPDRVKLPD